MSRQLNSPMHRHAAHASQHAYPGTIEIDTSPPRPADTPDLLPWEQIAVIQPMIDAQRRRVKLEIQAKIDKGFFRAEQDWTCYRRNYFAVACSYSLKLEGSGIDAMMPCYLPNTDPSRPVDRFSMCIAACINEDEARPVELVQHTPKRDKGPIKPPQRVMLKPNQSGQLGSAGTASLAGIYSPSSPYYQSSDGGRFASTVAPSPPPHPSDDQTMTSFDRIQFKRATANNGKRRAQQQYFHVRVELFAGFSRNGNTSSQSSDVNDFDWHKVAFRSSAQMVVRGRSPGHYSDSQHQNSTSMGGGSGMGGAPGAGLGGGLGVYGPQNGMASAQYGYNSKFMHGSSYHPNRSMVHDHTVEHTASMSSCNGLDEKTGISANGIMTSHPESYQDHSPFGNYGAAVTQSMGLLSPAFSVSSSALLNTPRSSQMMMPSPPHLKAADLPRRHEYKNEHSFIPRSDPGCPPSHVPHYEPEMNPGPWMNNGISLRECSNRWAPLPPGSVRLKHESMSPV